MPHATLGTEQLTFHTRTALVDSVAPLQVSYGGMNATLELLELLTKIHYILDNAVSEQVDNIHNVKEFHSSH